MDVNDNLELQQNEQRAFELYKQRYELRNAPPTKLHSTIAINWWEKNSKMLLSFVVTLAIVIGSRTGWSIYEINKTEGFHWILAAILAVLLVWSVEGFIAYYGLSRVRHLKISKLEQNIGVFAMLIGLLLSSVAGLDYVIGIASVLQVAWGNSVDVILSLLLSIGLTFILYGIAEFAGRARWEHENMPQIEEANYQAELKLYNNELETAWTESAEYMQLMGEQLRRANELKYDIDNAHVGRSGLRRKRQELELQAERNKITVSREFTGKLSGNSPIGNGSGKQEILDCIVAYVTEFNKFPRQVDIVNNTSVTKGYVSKLFSKQTFLDEVNELLQDLPAVDIPQLTNN